MNFTKMHGIGNDYVYVNGFQETILQPEEMARCVSNRYFSFGADGLILIKPSAIADFKMEMYNADGSKGKMCGNGIRCMAKYVYEKGLTKKQSMTIETLAGIREVELQLEKHLVKAVKVNMGLPVFATSEIPVRSSQKQILYEKINILERDWNITCVSMGNPHCVIFMEEPIEDMDIEPIGSALQQHPMFPEGVNVEFINIQNKKELQMRVWERGSGETLACGTGACAAVVAAALHGDTEENVTVHLKGGDLEIFWDRESGQVYMTGTATEVYEGRLNYNSYDVWNKIID